MIVNNFATARNRNRNRPYLPQGGDTLRSGTVMGVVSVGIILLLAMGVITFIVDGLFGLWIGGWQ